MPKSNKLFSVSGIKFIFNLFTSYEDSNNLFKIAF